MVHDKKMFWNVIKQVYCMLCEDRKVLQSMITEQLLQSQIEKVYTYINTITQISYLLHQFS